MQYRYLLLLVTVVLMAGCEQLMHGQTQPVTVRNGSYFTSCGGAVETWGSCNNKAMKTCPNGYIEISKEANATGTTRDLTFQCKK